MKRLLCNAAGNNLGDAAAQAGLGGTDFGEMHELRALARSQYVRLGSPNQNPDDPIWKDYQNATITQARSAGLLQPDNADAKQIARRYTAKVKQQKEAHEKKVSSHMCCPMGHEPYWILSVAGGNCIICVESPTLGCQMTMADRCYSSFANAKPHQEESLFHIYQSSIDY